MYDGVWSATMARRLEELRGMTDAELIAEHDRVAPNMEPGTDYYVDELNRRFQERVTKAAFRLTVANTILAAIAVIVAVVAIVLRSA